MFPVAQQHASHVPFSPQTLSVTDSTQQKTDALCMRASVHAALQQVHKGEARSTFPTRHPKSRRPDFGLPRMPQRRTKGRSGGACEDAATNGLTQGVRMQTCSSLHLVRCISNQNAFPVPSKSSGAEGSDARDALKD